MAQGVYVGQRLSFGTAGKAISSPKSSADVHHGVSPKHLQRYLDEYSYRFDRRWRESELFGFVLRRVARGQPLPYRLLVAEWTA